MLIPLTQGFFAMVDDADYVELSKHKWYANKSGATQYAICNKKPHTLGKLKMHHAVIGQPPKGMVTDHIDGNGLNNTRDNLRFVTVRQNQQNQVLTTLKKHSQFPGVSWFPYGKKPWVAGAKFNGKRKTIGYFHTEAEAHDAYLAAVGGY